MPELPEVLSISIFLNEKFQGKTLKNIKVYPNARELAPSSKCKDFPWKCEKVFYRSKRIIFKFITIKNEEIFLFSFLGMTGKWILFDVIKEQKEYIRMKCSFENCNLYYYDVRKLGNYKLYTKNELIDYFLTVGPDWYLDKISIEYFLEQSKKHSKKQVVQFLMDNKISTGIGNYLKSEILYFASRKCAKNSINIILPDNLMGELTLEQIEFLYSSCKEIIEKAILAGGFSLSDYLLPDGKKGGYHSLVYGKKISENNEKVLYDTFKDNRSTYWVKDFII